MQISITVKASCIYYIFLLAGHKVDLLPRAGQTNRFSDPLVEKKIMCKTGKKFILHV